MKVITKNSVYIIDVKKKIVTGGVLANRNLYYDHIGSVNKGQRLFFYDNNNNILLKTSPIQDITASLFDDEFVK
ncbi:hypothetical protein J2Z76_001226 [Sedimentibacter acidaminivorans]|jgi:hypothetical protein|uniref:Uncharacterized protein n=1 Tax=Sedimentibacter acidaminivorans TaxID=913099 RepID=A0ABS4GCI5_9FIRM|nr:hypothetical protein [Sedimentibacter acidaminivorans]MBP1925367.1 hypothetical protein [Sedimentibacter acidaminivorans]